VAVRALVVVAISEGPVGVAKVIAPLVSWKVVPLRNLG
jgi:hypothetical protein